MPTLVMTQHDNHWVELTGLGGKLLTTIRYGIKAAYRQFEQRKQSWMVHWSYLGFVVQMARAYGVEVDYSALPTTWQLRAAGAQVLVDTAVEARENPFARLFITEDAPIEVVHAAFRALAKKHHPDAGGSTAVFQQLDAAYRQILTLRGCA